MSNKLSLKQQRFTEQYAKDGNAPSKGDKHENTTHRPHPRYPQLPPIPKTHTPHVQIYD